MKNKWTELKIDNLPPDILIGDYEFLSPCGGPESGILEIIGEMLDGEECFYRKRQLESPSHEEIMTKWWKGDKEWIKATRYFYSGPSEYAYFNGVCRVSKNWFAGRESADIPPESE